MAEFLEEVAVIFEEVADIGPSMRRELAKNCRDYATIALNQEQE